MPWYKTTGGIIFLSLAGIVLAGVIAFLSLFGYYWWQISRGHGIDIAREFRTKNFTSAGRDLKPAGQIKSLKPYIHPFNPTRGPANAPITIVAFIDFECPFSQQGYPLFERVVDKYAPVARVIFKQFPIASLHPNSLNAATASACAHDQKKFWPYYDRLFQTKTLDRETLISQAQALGLDKKLFITCLDSSRHQSDIDEDLADGIALGVRGTPTYFVNTSRLEGVVDEATWDKIILTFLQQKP